jgi:single-strand DNA-binding protein
MLNRVQLIGNLGANPELKYTQGGQAVLRLRIATTKKWKDKSGDMKEQTEWHTCNLWGKRGESLNSILSKGRLVYIEGELQTRSWEKNGEKRSSTEVNVSELKLLGGGGGQRREQRQESFDGGSAYDTDGKGGSFDSGDDDIPF